MSRLWRAARRPATARRRRDRAAWSALLAASSAFTMIMAVLTMVSLAFGAVTVAVCPVSLDLPYPAVIAVQLGLAVALAALSARTPLSGVLALAAALEACAWALVSEPATLIALPVLAVTAAVTVVAARERAVRVGAAEAATLFRSLR